MKNSLNKRRCGHLTTIIIFVHEHNISFEQNYIYCLTYLCIVR